MKYFSLVLALLLPMAGQAQTKDSSPDPQPTNSVAFKQGPILSFSERLGISSTLGQDPRILLTTNSTPNLLPPQKEKSASSGKSNREGKKPKIEGSMVGYIDDAIVGNQFRVRFDSAFDDDFPDRSEFFYAKCSCYKLLGGAPSPISTAVDPHAPGPGPGVPTDLNFRQLYIDSEFAVISRFSLFMEIPIRWIQPRSFQTIPPFTPFGSEGGFGDLQLGLKMSLHASYRHALTLQLRSYSPTGNASQGLGTNHYTIEPALLYYQGFSNRWAMETQVGDWHPISGSKGVPVSNSKRFAGDVFFYGIGPSFQLYRGERFRFAPVVELVGWHIFSGFETFPQHGNTTSTAASDVSGTNIANIKFGGRMSFNNGSSVYLGYGRALTRATWYQSIIRFEYRYSF